MIENNYVFPECYIMKVPKCDYCQNETLYQYNQEVAGYNTVLHFRCPKCNREYKINESDLRGEWKWRIV